jgi:hypothetical protein
VGFASTATLGKSSELSLTFKSFNSRLVHFLSENKVLRKCQFGFLSNYRMTRPSIHPAHPNLQANKGKVFSCFVDFKKVLDSMWHDGLLNKLMESDVGVGVGGGT